MSHSETKEISARGRKAKVGVPNEVVKWTDIDLVKRHPSIMTRQGTVILVIDMQEKLMGTMKDRYDLISRAELLLAAAEILSIPIMLTEQYPKGLGHTDKRLDHVLRNAASFEKVSFSAVGDKDFMAALEATKSRRIGIVGIETHVCVAQTALDLKVRGYDVTVAADAVSSRRASDKDLALARMRDAGITISTVEAVVFELLEIAGTDEFKKVLKLVK